MAEPGFFERWAKRKEAARQGVALPEPEVSVQAANLNPALARSEVAVSQDKELETQQVQRPQAAAPTLTLQDANALTGTSDYKPFMAPQVSPEVRNAAMKKLFTDPHYNVMDGLDIYIDDYSKPDPIPEAMLRQMVSAQFLKLFAEEPATAVADPAELPPDTVKTDHDHTDLQLQPHDAAPAQDSGKRVA